MESFKVIGITGAGGFLGQALAKKLSKNYQLILFGKEKKYELENTSWIINDLFESSKENYKGIDTLIHLAGTPTQEKALIKNFNLTKHVLDCSVGAGIKKIIFASSYAIYGSRQTPATLFDKVNPLDDYAKSKELSEKYISEKEAIDFKILRVCSIYGEGGRGLIDIIKKRIKEKKAIAFDSLFERNYLHVDDFSEIIQEILEDNSKKNYYNITGERLSTKDLNKILLEHGIHSSINEKKKENFLCKGENKVSNNVENYLFEIKSKLREGNNLKLK